MRRTNLLFYFLLFVVVGLAYGLQIHRLGFYWDDWVFVYRYSRIGILDTIWYGPTRQLAIFLQAPGFLFAADSPLRWHIYMLALRWGIAAIFAWVLGLLWPARRNATYLMALLFAVHPAFTQNSIAVVYSVQIFGYGVFLLSIGLMICSLKDSRRFWLFTIAALLTQAFHLFSGEYYFGLELIRPLVVWVALGQVPNQFLKTVRFSSAYVVLLAFYLLWRFGIFTSGEFATYSYKTLPAAYAKDGFEAVITLIRYAMQDVIFLLVNVWETTLSPALIDFAQPYNLFSIFIVLLVSAGLYHVFTRVLPVQNELTPPDHFFKETFLLGFGAVLAGFVPSWFVMRFIVMPGNYGDRFALPGLLGASILIIALTEYLGNPARNRNILMASLLIALAVGQQIRVSNNYRWDWERQTRTYWQTYWRAPALQPGTILVGGNAISTTTVNYVGAFAYNFVYPSQQAFNEPSVWFVNYYKVFLPEDLQKFEQGELEPKDRHSNIEITLTRQNLLAIHYDTDDCLRVLEPDILDLYNIDEEYRGVAAVSNPDLILPGSAQTPPRHIFGAEPVATWCYFYQKADLARQFGDWESVLVLEQEAQNLGLEPRSDFERLPFIEAHARTGDWQTALDLSLAAYQSTRKTATALCALWSTFENPNMEMHQVLVEKLSCGE